MKKFFSLVLALVMVMGLTTVAWGVDITDEATLKTALTTSGDYTLTAAVTLDEQVIVPAGTDVTINLNGQTLTLDYDANYAIVAKGNLTISGTGNVVVSGYGISTGYNSTGSVTINGGTYTASGCDYLFGCFGGTITINAGVFNGEFCVVNNFAPYYGVAGTVVINNGDFSVSDPDGYTVVALDSNDAVVADAISVSGGTFIDDVSEYVADGKQLLANGSVVAAPAAGATDPVLYVWDTAAKDWAAYYIATGMDMDDLKYGADEDCLPCYFIDGKYYVDTTEAAATYKLVYGATKLFLAPVDSTDVCYDAKATVFTNVTTETDICGKLVVTDTTKTYYVFYDVNDYDEDYYFVATKNGSIQLLVGGKIVDVELNAAQDLTAHVWKGYDVVNNTYTTAKCENCGKVVKLYATGTAAGKGAHHEAGLGYITKIDNGFGASVSVKPSTDKTVQSAQTFDAGIAMYVGMSVMAAAGGAVVIGKKKD